MTFVEAIERVPREEVSAVIDDVYGRRHIGHPQSDKTVVEIPVVEYLKLITELKYANDKVAELEYKNKKLNEELDAHF